MLNGEKKSQEQAEEELGKRSHVGGVSVCVFERLGRLVRNSSEIMAGANFLLRAVANQSRREIRD